MSYNGYLLKLGGTNVSPFIYKENFSITPCQRQDLDSYRDADGVLHRTTLPHTATKIEFNTKPMHEADMERWRAIVNNAISENVLERKATVEYFDTFTGEYKTGTFYIPDVQFPIYLANEDTIIYSATRYALIEY